MLQYSLTIVFFFLYGSFKNDVALLFFDLLIRQPKEDTVGCSDIHVTVTAVERDRAGLVITTESDSVGTFRADIKGAVDDRRINERIRTSDDEYFFTSENAFKFRGK